MKKLVALSLFCSLAGCRTSVPAEEFNASFPSYTNQTFVDRSAADLRIAGNQCIQLNRHTFAANVGATVSADMRNAAREVEARIWRDDGNAYTINKFTWLPIPGGTQLNMNIDTLRCAPSNRQLVESERQRPQPYEAPTNTAPVSTAPLFTAEELNAAFQVNNQQQSAPPPVIYSPQPDVVKSAFDKARESLEATQRNIDTQDAVRQGVLDALRLHCSYNYCP